MGSSGASVAPQNVLNGGKGARALCPRIDQSLDAGCHLGLVHGLGHGGSLQLQVISCEGPSCVLSITNRLRAPALKRGLVQSWAALQCSCLENPRDGGAWWAAIYGVTQSRTRLKQLSSSSSNALEY